MRGDEPGVTADATGNDGATGAALVDVRQLTTPAARALADLAVAYEDLQTVLRCCERLVLELGPARNAADDLALEAYWTTAVLSYARCFVTGPRGMGLTEDDITSCELKGDVLSWHRILLQLRDQYSDPALNPRETFSVGVSRDAAGAPTGIAVASTRRPLVDEVTVRQIGAIAYGLSGVVDRRLADQQRVVFTAVGGLSPAELGALPALDLADPDDVGTAHDSARQG